jgi:hypothetical protein
MAITYHAGRRIQGLDSEKPIDASTTEFYDQAIGNGSLDLYTDIPRLGVKAVSGNGTGHINKIKVWLRVIGTHTSTNPVYARVRKISDDSIVATATKTIADLTSGTTITEYEFDFGSCVEITSAEHYVLIEYAYGDASNYLGLTRYSGAVTGWEWTSYNGSSYTTNSTQSLSGTFSSQVGHVCSSGDVQVGSRFEATDTRKMYYYNAPTLTFEDDFSSSPNGWTLNAYASGQSITGGALVSTVSRSNGYKTLAIGEPTNYVLDFDWKWDNSTRDTPFIILASDITGSTSSTSGYGDPPAGHKRIIFMTANNTGNLYISSRYNNGAAQEENSTLVSGGTAGSYNVKYFYRVVKSGNDVSFKRYLTDANRTAGASLQQETNLTMNNTNYTATADYAYLEVGAHGFYGQNTLYDFKFYSGVTSPDTVWSELGT